MEHLIHQYGYLAILVGAFIEGEAILLLGGLAAYAGYLALPWVIFVAFCGTLLADQFYFHIGRRHSHRILALRPSLRERASKAEALFSRFRTPLILVFRFFFGIRTILVFIIGMSPIPSTKFAVLNALGAAIWAVSVGMGGYFFGSAIEILLRKVQVSFLAVLAATGLVVWSVRVMRRRKGRS